MVNKVAFELAKGLAQRDLAAYDFGRADVTATKLSPGRPKSRSKLDETKPIESETNTAVKEHARPESIKINGDVVDGDELKDVSIFSPERKGTDSEDSVKTDSLSKAVESGRDKDSPIESKVHGVREQKAVESEKTAAAKKIGDETHKTTIES